MSQARLTAEDTRWKLDELFRDVSDPAIAGILETASEKADGFVTTYKGRLAELTGTGLASAFQTYIDISTPLYKVSQYAHLRYAVETDNDLVKALVAKVDTELPRISNKLMFFHLELAAVDESTLEAFLADPALEAYRYGISHAHKTARYNLGEKEEQVINLKDVNGINAHQKLYEELTTSFSFEFELDGELQTLTGDQLRALRQHPDPDTRRRAMSMFFERYADNRLTLTHLYNAIVRDYGMEAGLRGYASPISRMNTHNDLEDEAIGTLNGITTESYPLVHRYYRLKEKILGLDDMTLADIYAPLPSVKRTYDFASARGLVLDSFAAFDDEFFRYADTMFRENRIDAPALPGKRGGAFCSSSTPDLNPYVLLNFTGKVRDVATMAHELGHAIHAFFSQKQNLLNYHSILPLAETASIFSEMLLTDHFLKQETNREVKISLICNKLEDIFASSHRQNMFSSFEIESHAAINKDLQSSEQLCSMYENQLKLMFGDSVRIASEYRWEWSSIPHIYNVPFYVYAYNFGNLLVLGLYQLYLEQGREFIQKYKRFLSLGSSASPGRILETVGVDLRDPGFWKKSLAYIESLTDQLTNLLSTK